MGDWPSAALYPLPTIHPWSLESIGIALLGAGEGFAFSSAVYPVASRAFYIPFYVGVPSTVYQMFAHNGATATGNVDVGIYTDEGAKLVSSGSTAQAGTDTLQLFNITDTLLSPGTYYMALSCDSGSSTFFRQTTGVLVPAWGILNQATAFPLPSPATFARTGGSYIPLYGLSVRAVF